MNALAILDLFVVLLCGGFALLFLLLFLFLVVFPMLDARDLDRQETPPPGVWKGPRP